MPGLERTLVEHRFLINEGVRPIWQALRRMTSEIMALVQQEIHKLLKAGFIRTFRSIEWISNIVPVKQKNGKIRVFIDFQIFFGFLGSQSRNQN